MGEFYLRTVDTQQAMKDRKPAVPVVDEIHPFVSWLRGHGHQR